MSKTAAQGSKAKNLYTAREEYELRLSKVQESGDRTLEWTVYSEYIDWELTRKRRRDFNFELANAIYQRAVLHFPTDVSLWEDYVMFLIGESMHGHASTTTIATLDRGTRHCPWSGNLWSQYILSSEREGQSFSKISNIKHKATSTGLLDAGGMEEVLKVHVTWCSYLRRRAFLSEATDEDLDVAEVGIRSAIESVQELGEKKYGRSYQGDPLFRLERIYIRYLSESGSWDSARETFKGLVPRRGNSYEFWLTYYGWELISWSKFVQGEATVDAARRTPNPSYATAVLKQAIKRQDLDWPEKIVQTYIAHCEDYEDSDELQLAVIETRKAMRAVNARRETEAREAAAVQQQQQQQQQWEAAAAEASTSEKRKREDDANGEPTSKKARAEETAIKEEEPVGPSRDREHATVVVKNLPLETSEHQVRQFFRHVSPVLPSLIEPLLTRVQIGTINGVKMISGEDKKSEIAIIEFDTQEEALSAQTRDQKDFHGNTIEVKLDTDTTLFVTNFPPTADEEYIRNLFGKYGEVLEVRFPSLKYQTSRRFCYVQFATSSAAHQATELDGTSTENGHKLIAKISDPSKKQNRSGPMQEGREIFCKNVDFKLGEKDVREAFTKFGTIEKFHMPVNVDGSRRGFCFLTFSTKEEAEAALAMNEEMLGSRRLQVNLSGQTGAKRMTSTIISRVRTSASPSAEVNGDGSNVVETSGERGNRTLGLMNIPDTVNDARIRALVEPFGQLIKIVLRPDHQGAIVEFADVNDAGKASLALEGKEIVPGRPLHVGSVAELKMLHAERKTDRITSIKQEKPKPSLQPAGPIKRPQQPGAHGGRRGGLGLKRATAHGPSDKATPDNDKMDTTADSKDGDGGKSKKSNDDFRAMLQQNRTA
jgi:RNA recognition motif-containing protein